jgi:hypothetical protein
MKQVADERAFCAVLRWDAVLTWLRQLTADRSLSP